MIGTKGEVVIVGGFGAGGYIVTAGGKEEPLLPPDAPGGFLTSFGPYMLRPLLRILSNYDAADC